MTRSSVEFSRTVCVPPRLVVVAASLGGLQSLNAALSRLPREFPAPIVVAHHLAVTGRSYLAELLRPRTALPVHWATQLEVLKPGHVYVGPPRTHVTVSASRRTRLIEGPKYNYVQPAADLLFRSAAEHFGSGVIAVVLSGRLRDGAAGAGAVHDAGGLVIAEDPATAAAPGMPNAAIGTGTVKFVLPPRVIGSALVSLAMVPGAADLFGVGAGRRSAAA